MSLINDIIEEWAYRVNNGMPNPKNSKHLDVLSSVLTEMGLGNIKNELLKNLMEADDEKFVATKKDTGETSVFKSKELRFSDGNRQVLLPRKTPSGKTLSLQYDKVTASELDTFVEFYRIHGTSELFTLPTNIPILLPYRTYNSVLNHWRLTNELDIETIVSTSTNGAYTFVLNMEVTENING
jgi:hypothetical protein